MNLHLRKASPQRVSHGSHRERTRTPPSPAQPPRSLFRHRCTCSQRHLRPHAATVHEREPSSSCTCWKTLENAKQLVGKRSQIGGEELAGATATSEQPPSLHLRSQGRKEQQTLISGERICTATCQHLIGSQLVKLWSNSGQFLVNFVKMLK